MKKLVVFGAGDTARTLHAYLTREGRREVAAFSVDKVMPGKDHVLGLEVVPFEGLERRFPPNEFAMMVAISYGKLNEDRARVFRECVEKGYELVSFISSTATQYGTLGAHCVMLEHSATQPHSRIGDDVVLCVGSIIGHDCIVGDHCFVGPNAVVSGRVQIGPSCFIGANAALRDGIHVGSRCVIGAGVVLLHDAKDGEIYLSPPSRRAAIGSRALQPYFGMGTASTGHNHEIPQNS